MKLRGFRCAQLLCLLLAKTAVLAQAGAGAPTFELKLGEVTALTGGVASLPLSLSAGAPAQGFVAVFEWEESRGGGVGIAPGSALASADLVSLRADSGGNFGIVGVIMDIDGQGGEIIPAGDQDIGTAEIRCSAEEGPFAVRFVDGQHALVDGGPPLDNLVVIDGSSLTVADGLVLTDGSVDCRTVAPALTIEGGMNDPSNPDEPDCGDVRVLLTSAAEVGGITLAICHDSSVLRLDAVRRGTATKNAEFFQEEIVEGGGTVGVIMDIMPPLNNNILPGEKLHVATFRYCCRAPAAPGEPEVSTPLEFCDLVLGNPLKDNLVVIDSESVVAENGLVLENGQFVCKPALAVEVCDNTVDDDGDGLEDCADPDCALTPPCRSPGLMQVFACGGRELGPDGEPSDLQGALGTPTEVCFFLKNPVAPQGVGEPVQGFTMAMTFCCDLLTAGETLDTAGTIVEALGADFANLQVDNDPDDGDGCELVLAFLVDALPPFEGETIPALDIFQRVGCVDFTPKESAACGDCCQLAFVDGVDGSGRVPVKNLVSIEDQARPALLQGCEFCIADAPQFFRGDCNFSGESMAMAVDIADAASIVSFLLTDSEWVFNPQCEDACDCDDDGRIDLADALCVLRFLIANELPPAPGAGIAIDEDGGRRFSGPGVDPTADMLDCKGDGGCPE